MPKLAERGVAHILLILILLAGIVAGVYLVQEGPKIFKPKASELRPSDSETSFQLIRDGLSKDEVVVKLYARSDISAANVFSAKINFPKELLEVTAIDVESKVSSISKGPQSLVKEVFADEKECEHDSDCQSGYFCVGKDASKRLGISWDTCAKEESKNVSGNKDIGGECKWDGDCKAPPDDPTRGYCCTAENCGTRQYKCTNKDGTIPGIGGPEDTRPDKAGPGEDCQHDSDCRSGYFCPGKDAAKSLGIPVDKCYKEESAGGGSLEIGGKCSRDSDCKPPAGESRGYCCTAEDCGKRQYKCTNKDGTIPGSAATQSGTAGSPRNVNLNWSEKTAVGDANRDGTISLVAQAQGTVKTRISQDSLLLAIIKFKVKKQEGEAKIEFDNNSRITNPDGVDLQLKKEGVTIQLGTASSAPSQPITPDPLACKNTLPECGKGLTCVKSTCQSSCGSGKSQCWADSNKGLEINCCNQIKEESLDCGGKLGKLCPDGYECRLPEGSRDAEGECVPTSTIKVEPSEIKSGEGYTITWANGSTDKPDTIRVTENSGSQWTIFTTSCKPDTSGDFRDISRSSPKRNGQCQFNGGEEQVLTFRLINSKGEAIGNSATLTVRE